MLFVILFISLLIAVPAVCIWLVLLAAVRIENQYDSDLQAKYREWEE